MNRKLQNFSTLKKNLLLIIAFLAILSPVFGQADTTCAAAARINDFRSTLFSDTARWHVFMPPSDGTIEISTCNYGFTPYLVVDGCFPDTICCSIDSLSIMACNQGTIELFPAVGNEPIYIEVRSGGGLNDNKVAFEYTPQDICPGNPPIPLLCNVPIDTMTTGGISQFNAIYYLDCVAEDAANATYQGADLVFAFQSTGAQNIYFKLSNLTGNLDFFLFDDLCNTNANNINCLLSDTEDSGSEKVIGPLTLPVGTYYIIIDGETTTTEGSFRLEATCPDCDYVMPNFEIGEELFCNSVTFDSTFNNHNAFQAADYDNCYSGPKTYEGLDKLYYVDIPLSSELLTFSLNNLEDDYDLFIFDSNFECINSSVNDGTADENIILQNTFGRFYIVVDISECGVNSDFSISISCDCELTASLTADPAVICENEVTTITADVITGLAPFQFSWSDQTQESNQNGISSIEVGTGTHCVTITDNANCSRVRCIEVDDSGTPFINELEVTPASCFQNNGTITVDIVGTVSNGDTLMYSLDSITFQTENVFTNLAAGFYTVYVTSTNGCANLDDTFIEDLPPPTITSIQTTIDSCGLGIGSLTIVADSPNGGLEYSLDGENFQLSNTFNNLMAAVYNVSIIDHSNCIISEATEVMASPAAQINNVTVVADTCGTNSGRLTIQTSGGTGTVLYSLDNIDFQTNPVFSSLSGGIYTVYVKDDNNCIVTRETSINTLGAPEIVTSPMNAAGCAGQSAIFGVEAILQGPGNIAYQWQTFTNGNWVNLNNVNVYSGVLTDTLRISNISGLNDQRYRVLLSSQFCNQDVISDEATLRVDGPLSIAQHPMSQGLCTGTGTIFTIAAISGSTQPISYQWQLSTNLGVDWNNIPNGGLYSGSQTDTLRISNATNLNNFMYRVNVFSDFCSMITSEPATLEIERPMSITAQPNNFNVCSGENVSFSFTINSNGFDGPQFQWQVSPNGGNNWTDIINNEVYSGATTTTLNIGNVDGLNDYLYRAAVIGEFCDILYTNPAVLSVTGQVAISDQPDDLTTCVGESASFSFSTGNSDMDESFDIQWEVSSDNGQNYTILTDGALYNGTTTTTLTISDVTGLNNYRFRGKLSSDNCQATTSQVAILTVSGPLTISSQPSTITVCAGQAASFSSVATNNGVGGLVYNWQVNTDGAMWVNLVNNNVYNGVQTTTLSISNTLGLNNHQYRLLVGNDVCPSISSQAATLITEGPISFGNQPQSIATCDDGDSVTFGAIAVNQGAGAITYQWEMSDDNVGFSPIGDDGNFNGVNGMTLTINDISGLNGKRFRLSASTPFCAPVYSNPATLTVEGPISITGQVQDVMSCAGEAVTFSVEAFSGAGGTLNYRWQINNEGTWMNLQNNTIYNGTTTNTLSIANTNNLNNQQYRVIIVTSLCTIPVVSEPASLMVQTAIGIAQQPQNQTLCSGESATFSTAVNASAETNVSYQWQISIDNGMNWVNLNNQSPYNNVTTPNLVINNVNNLNNHQYRAKVFTAFCDELFTNAATLTVEGPIAIISQPLDLTECSGNSATFHIDASNAGAGNIAYQWFISTNQGENYFELMESNFNYNGTTSPNLNVLNTSNLDGALFRVEVSTPNCPTITSVDARLSVEGPITIVSQPTNQAACDDGAPILFSASVQNQNSGMLSYQWEVSENGNNFLAIENNDSYAGANSPTLTILNAGNFSGLQYRLVVQTSSCSPLISNVAALTVSAPDIENVEIVEDTCGLNNGSLQILANGGFGNLLYSLNNDNFQTSNRFLNLAGTNYTVYVQDENGCTVSQDVTVPSFDAPQITNIQVTPDTCGRHVGSLIVTATGNTPNLLYAINDTDFQPQNTFINLPAAAYSIRVRDGFNCTSQMNTNLGEAGGMLSLNLTLEENSGANPNDAIVCAGEEITLTATASGGNDDYIYTWNNGLADGGIQVVAPLNNTTYVVRATDGNLCFALDSISITVQASPIASTNSNSPVCEGEAIIFSAAGGTVYEWIGPNGFTSSVPNPTIPISRGQDAGTYTLTINNQNNCPNTASLDVVVIGATNYPAMVSVTDNFICAGDEDETVRLTGNLYPSINARGVWFTNSTGVDIDGVVNPNATATELNDGENIFIWALSNEVCDEFATDSVTVFLEPLPQANNDSIFSFENVDIESFSVIENDHIENLVDWEIELVKQPERAEVTYLGDGLFSVQPEETFFGELVFAYRLVSLSCNRFVEAKVIINIKENNEAVHCVWTPQTDGPLWEICRPISKDNTLRIIDRYGHLVHSASPYLNDWDGTDIETGQPVPTGTYYFILTQNKDTESDDEILGTVVLLR